MSYWDEPSRTCVIYVEIDVIPDGKMRWFWFRRFIALGVLNLLVMLNPTFMPLELKGDRKWN